MARGLSQRIGIVFEVTVNERSSISHHSSHICQSWSPICAKVMLPSPLTLSMTGRAVPFGRSATYRFRNDCIQAGRRYVYFAVQGEWKVCGEEGGSEIWNGIKMNSGVDKETDFEPLPRALRAILAGSVIMAKV